MPTSKFFSLLGRHKSSTPIDKEPFGLANLCHPKMPSFQKYLLSAPFSISPAEDEFIPSSVGKAKNGHAAKKTAAAAEKPDKLKPVDATDFFASTALPAAKLPKIPKIEKKKGTRLTVFSNLSCSKEEERKSKDNNTNYLLLVSLSST